MEDELGRPMSKRDEAGMFAFVLLLAVMLAGVESVRRIWLAFIRRDPATQVQR